MAAELYFHCVRPLRRFAGSIANGGRILIEFYLPVVRLLMKRLKLDDYRDAGCLQRGPCR